MFSSSHANTTELIPIVNPVSFAQWEIDLLRRFSISKIGLYQFLIVAVDYFTKWVKTEPLADIKAFNIELCGSQSLVGLECPKSLLPKMELNSTANLS